MNSHLRVGPNSFGPTFPRDMACSRGRRVYCFRSERTRLRRPAGPGRCAAPGIAAQFYCLDEPLQHLDLGHQAEALRLFRRLATEEGKTVLMVLHETLWAGRFCDYALLLYDNGEIASGSASELLTGENLERLYQCGLRELPTEDGRCWVPA